MSQLKNFSYTKNQNNTKNCIALINLHLKNNILRSYIELLIKFKTLTS